MLCTVPLFFSKTKMSLGPKNVMAVGNCSPLKTGSAFRFESSIVGSPALSLDDCNSEAEVTTELSPTSVKAKTIIKDDLENDSIIYILLTFEIMFLNQHYNISLYHIISCK